MENIIDELILKIQLKFDGPTGSLVLKILRDKVKHVFTEPEIEATSKINLAAKLLDTERLL